MDASTVAKIKQAAEEDANGSWLGAGLGGLLGALGGATPPMIARHEAAKHNKQFYDMVKATPGMGADRLAAAARAGDVGGAGMYAPKDFFFKMLNGGSVAGSGTPISYGYLAGTKGSYHGGLVNLLDEPIEDMKLNRIFAALDEMPKKPLGAIRGMLKDFKKYDASGEKALKNTNALIRAGNAEPIADYFKTDKGRPHILMRPEGKKIQPRDFHKFIRNEGKGHYSSLNGLKAMAKSLFVPKSWAGKPQFNPAACPPGATHCGQLPAKWLQSLGKQPSNVSGKLTLPGHVLTNPNLKPVGVTHKGKMLRQTLEAGKMRGKAGLLAAAAGAVGLGGVSAWMGNKAQSLFGGAGKPKIPEMPFGKTAAFSTLESLRPVSKFAMATREDCKHCGTMHECGDDGKCNTCGKTGGYGWEEKEAMTFQYICRSCSSQTEKSGSMLPRSTRCKCGGIAFGGQARKAVDDGQQVKKEASTLGSFNSMMAGAAPTLSAITGTGGGGLTTSTPKGFAVPGDGAAPNTPAQPAEKLTAPKPAARASTNRTDLGGLDVGHKPMTSGQAAAGVRVV